jgi:hypothetical protein
MNLAGKYIVYYFIFGPVIYYLRCKRNTIIFTYLSHDSGNHIIYNLFG